jgi:putative membrane protein
VNHRAAVATILVGSNLHRQEHEGCEMAGPSPQHSRAVRPGLVLALALAVLAVVFIAQNRDRMQISFFTVDVSAPTWLLLTIMTVVGLAVGALLGRARR